MSTPYTSASSALAYNGPPHVEFKPKGSLTTVKPYISRDATGRYIILLPVPITLGTANAGVHVPLSMTITVPAGYIAIGSNIPFTNATSGSAINNGPIGLSTTLPVAPGNSTSPWTDATEWAASTGTMNSAPMIFYGGQTSDMVWHDVCYTEMGIASATPPSAGY